ncbi:MAG: PKD domain-containing protein [Candidatus Paceibacteria bacterium]
MKNKKTGSFLLLSISILFVSAFYFPANSESKDIVITEISAYKKRSCDWFEVYNKSSRKIDLKEWIFWDDNVNHYINLDGAKPHTTSTIIRPKHYAVIANKPSSILAPNNQEHNCEYQYNISSSTPVLNSSFSLNETGGEEIALKKSTSFLDVVEKFKYLSLGDCNLDKECTSLERVSAQDLDYTSDNWKFLSTSTSTPTSTPGRPNYHQSSSGSINKFNPSFNVHSSTSIARGVTTTFVENSTNTKSREWNLKGDNNIQKIGNKIRYKFSDTGDHIVTLLGYDDKGAVSATGTEIEVTKPPKAEIKSPSSSNVNTEVSFQADILSSPAPITDYLWSFGDNNSSTNKDTSHSYASTGTYQTKLKIKDKNMGTDIATDSIKILPKLSKVSTTNSNVKIDVKIQAPDTATKGEKVSFPLLPQLNMSGALTEKKKSALALIIPSTLLPAIKLN